MFGSDLGMIDYGYLLHVDLGDPMTQQQIQWRYGLVWSPGSPASEAALYRYSSRGQRYKWAVVSLPASLDAQSLDQVLEELYAAVLALMEATC